MEAAVRLYRKDGPRSLLNAGLVRLLAGRPGVRLGKLVLGDRLHQQVLSYFRLGYWPRIDHPRTFNEKLLHRKLSTNDHRFSTVEDKWRARDYVQRRVGEEILPTVYQVTDDPDSIRFGELPDSYVIKPTHLSGQVVIVDASDVVDTAALVEQCRTWLATEYGATNGEYWYRDIEPRIIVEERLTDERFYVPADFKFYVFDGRVELLYVLQQPTKGAAKEFNYYDREWEPVAIDFQKWTVGQGYERPPQLEAMIEIAEMLGAGFDHLRVDLYAPNDDRIVFGELTVCEGSGGHRFSSWEDDLAIGSYWTMAQS